MGWVRRWSLAAAVSGALVLSPGAALADSASHTYLLEFGEANVGIAPSGDRVHISCEATEGL